MTKGMMESPHLRRAAWAALVLLAACGGPRGDWRNEFGRTTPNPVVLTPALPLVIPATAELPPPGGANRATPGR
jgi:hypothetical protein